MRPVEIHAGQIWVSKWSGDVVITTERSVDEYGDAHWNVIHFSSIPAPVPRLLKDAWLRDEVRHQAATPRKHSMGLLRDCYVYCGCLPTGLDLKEHGAALLQLSTADIESDKHDQTES